MLLYRLCTPLSSMPSLLIHTMQPATAGRGPPAPRGAQGGGVGAADLGAVEAELVVSCRGWQRPLLQWSQR